MNYRSIIFLIFICTFSLVIAGENKIVPTKYFDLIHTDLSLRPIWKNHTMKGEATLTLVAYFHPQDTLVLDAKNLAVEKVEVWNKKLKSELKYETTKTKLKIYLDKRYTPKDTLVLKIAYTAIPDSIKNEKGEAITDNKGLYFINTDQKKKDVPTHLWTQGETEANSAWFPTIDHPSEKHTQTIQVTYEDKYVSLSNGKLMSSKKNNDGTKTDIWSQKLPHSVYLTVLVIGDFKIVKDNWKGKEVSYYMEPKYEAMARPIFGRTPEMISFFSDKLGVSFPWDKYSQVIVHEYVSGAMENTGAVTFNTMFQKDHRELIDDNDDETVAHELFHHWFGDLVTCESWTHLTLNESFANYSEYLWYEYKYGKDEAENHWVRDMSPYFSSASRNRQSLVRYDYEKPDDMFDVISYNKGGKILHQLRVYLGDDVFFKSLNLYLTRYAYKTAEYSDLRKCFEEISGEDLTWYFDQWYLKGGHPLLNTSYKKLNDQTVLLTLNQKHNFDTSFVYRLPLDIDIYTGDVVKRKRVVLDKVKDSFVFHESEVKAIVVDAQNALVGVKSETKSIEDWIFILKNARSYLTQSNAIKKFKNQRSKDIVKDAIYEALNSEKPRTVREAIRMIDESWLEKDGKWNAKLISIAQKNGKGVTRSAAIEKLAENKNLDTFRMFALEKLKDSSYLVETEALQLYAKIDSASALDYAKKAVNISHFGLLNTVYEIIGKTRDVSTLPLFEKAADQVTGFKKMAIYNNMAKIIPLMPNNYVDEKIALFQSLLLSKDDTDNFLGQTALGVLKGEYSKREDANSKEYLKKIEEILKTNPSDDNDH